MYAEHTIYQITIKSVVTDSFYMSHAVGFQRLLKLWVFMAHGRKLYTSVLVALFVCVAMDSIHNKPGLYLQ